MRITRLTRTVLLGTAAAAAGIVWLGRAYEVDAGRLLGFAGSSVLLVAVPIALAVVGGSALAWLRGRRRKRRLDSRFLQRRPGPPTREAR